MARKNIYLLAGHGGPEENGYIKDAMRESGKDCPRVAYIGTANGGRIAFFARMRESLIAAGAGNVEYAPLTGEGADDDKAAEVLSGSDVIFISGGEVEDGMNGLSERIRALLWQLYDDGRVFIGISAGTIMMGLAWPHWDDEDNDFDNARLFDCIGFVNTIFDTHCEDEGWPELKKAVELSEEGFIGCGIPAGGLVVFTPDGKMKPAKKLDKYINRGGAAVPV